MDAKNRQRRRNRSRARITGSATRPRVSIFRSARQVMVQLIDDAAGHTLLALEGKAVQAKGKLAQAEQVGQQLAVLAKAKGIKKAVFDRSGYKYHGRVRAVAEGLRAGGVKI